MKSLVLFKTDLDTLYHIIFSHYFAKNKVDSYDYLTKIFDIALC